MMKMMKMRIPSYKEGLFLLPSQGHRSIPAHLFGRAQLSSALPPNPSFAGQNPPFPQGEGLNLHCFIIKIPPILKGMGVKYVLNYFALVVISSFKSLQISSNAMVPLSPSLRERTATAPASASLSPTTNI